MTLFPLFHLRTLASAVLLGVFALPFGGCASRPATEHRRPLKLVEIQRPFGMTTYAFRPDDEGATPRRQ